jgi:multiple sugar transport system substrate-binding protein
VRRQVRRRSVSRRDFLKTTGAVAGAAGLAPGLAAPFVSTALAKTKTLEILQWSHFIPEYDKWIDAFAKEWGKNNGITVDHIAHLELPARKSPPARGMTYLGSTDQVVRISTPSTCTISPR